jgi:hypothetical protein
MRVKKTTAQVSAKGMALILTLFLVLILMILAAGIASVGIIEAKSTVNYQNSSKAYYLARAGITYGANHIRNRYLKEGYVGGTSSPHLEEVLNKDERFKVVIWAPQENLGSYKKVWRVTSTGYSNGAQRQLAGWVMMETFAEYAYFSDSETIHGSPIWWNGNGTQTGRVQVQGRIHTNGYFQFRDHPIFDGIVTSSNGRGRGASNPIAGKDDPYWYKSTNRYVQGGTTTTNPANFFHYYASYSRDRPIGVNSDFSFKGGKPEIIFPTEAYSTKRQADHKYNSSIRISFSSSGRAKISYDSDPSRYHYRDTDDLTIHSTGKIIVEGGTIKGNVTIYSDKDVVFKKSVVYANKARDTFGIVAGENIVIDTNPYVVQDMVIHGSLIALKGALYTKDHDIGVKRGYLDIYGGVINRYRGPNGTILGGTGYRKRYALDPKLIRKPPPNFPTTGNVRILLVEDFASL